MEYDQTIWGINGYTVTTWGYLSGYACIYQHVFFLVGVSEMR